jgi:hypothetical protein
MGTGWGLGLGVQVEGKRWCGEEGTADVCDLDRLHEVSSYISIYIASCQKDNFMCTYILLSLQSAVVLLDIGPNQICAVMDRRKHYIG